MPDDGEALVSAEPADGGEDGGRSGSSPAFPRSSGSGAGLGPDEAGSGTAMPAGQIPPPLSEDEIKAMDEAQLRKHLTDVSKARQYAKDNKELDERLKKEFTMILTRLRELPKEGG
jgi:hypothetical protein